VLGVGGQVPLGARAAAVRPLAENAHQHAGEPAAEDVHARGDPVERPRPALERQARAVPAQGGGEPQRALLHAQLERGAELDGAHARVESRQELEVGHVAGGPPARPEPVEAQALQLLPAPGVAPRAAAQPLERPAGVAEHRGERRRPARRALPRRDRDLDFLDLRNARGKARDHRRGQGGDAARARDGEAIGRARRRLQVLGEARDELPAVGEVEVMRAGGERCARHAVALGLERPGAVDHEVGREALQARGELGRRMVQARVLHGQAAEGARSLVGIAAGRDDFHTVRGEPAADAGAEVAVASDHDDAHPSPGPDYVIGILQPFQLCRKALLL
jgi:hypothetical protein